MQENIPTERNNNHLDFIAKIILLVSSLSLITGFLIWNLYLDKFGFSEFDLIQTKFISTGLAFLLISALILLPILKLLSEQINKLWGHLKTLNKYEAFVLKSFIFVILCFSFIYFIRLYSLSLFIYLPSYYGGAVPEVISIIGPPQEIERLGDQNIVLSENGGGKKPIQTAHICKIYENFNSVIIFVPSISIATSTNKEIQIINYRLLKLKKDSFDGFGSIKGDPTIEEVRKACISFFNDYLLKK